MPSPSDDRIAHLEARLAEQDRRVLELEQQARRRPRLSLPRLSLARRLLVVGLGLMLALPAGVVLASHRFSDVPTSHQFHNAIAAVADAGVTAGCGGTRYCPNGLVTRGQMAAFLSRLGALAPGSAPKVNADRVDGRHANQLSRVASFSTGATTALATTETQYGPNLVITAPTAGFVTVNYGFTLQTPNCVTSCIVLGEVRHVESNALTGLATLSVSTTIVRANASVHGVFPVGPGANTFQLALTRNSSEGTINGWFATGTALFTPFGSTGGSTLGTISADSPEGGITKEP